MMVPRCTLNLEKISVEEREIVLGQYMSDKICEVSH